MELLEKRILAEGKVRPGNILKVDSFLNHQLDPELFHAMAEELRRLFAGERVDKILTVEASGIALAVMTGYVFASGLFCPYRKPCKPIEGDSPCLTKSSTPKKQPTISA